MQYVKFPMSTLRITQGYGLEVDGISTSVSGGTYSHTGSYALDLGGIDTGADYLYAPCDVTVVRHYVGSSGYNAVWYQTNEEVMCADGTARQLVFMLLHANDDVITELDITVGKTFAQGDAFYKEGTGGGVATHCHLEVGLAPFEGTGWYQSDYVDDRGVNVWIINNKLIPSEIFYLTDETNIVEDMGYNWRYLTDNGYVEYDTPTGVRVLTGTGKNVQYFNTTDVNDVAGNHLPEGSEYIAVGHTTIADDNGFTYVKFIYDDGNEYWMAILNDRITIYERNVSNDVSSILDKVCFVQVQGTGYNLNVHGNDVADDERNVNIYATEDVKAQRWVLRQTDAGLKLFTAINEIYALNIYRIDNNCSIYTAKGNDADSILELENIENNLYKIRSATHGLYLTVDGNLASGTNVVWADSYADATVWEFISEEEMFPSTEEDPAPIPEFTEEGIDVSDYQGVIDWAKVAATGQKFAILKAVGSNSNGIYISTYWEDNYQGAKDNGIKVGAYLYTYAFNETEAEEELTYLLQALKGKQFEYPIFIDVEDALLYQNCTVKQITTTVKYLCARLKEEGYYPAVYTYTYFANTYLNMTDLAEYDLWIADYTGEVTYVGDYTIWQYTSTGSVDGIDGNVDMNISYKDYKTIIENERLNGFMANEKNFNVRLKLKYDSHENWIANDPVLLAGEVAISTVSVKQAGTVNTVPAVLMKVGDGEKKYSELDFTYAKAADVIEAAKSEATLTAFINNVIANAGIASSEAMTALTGRVSTAEGEIDALQAKVGDSSVADQIKAAIDALKLSETYEVKGAAADALADAKEYADGLNTAMDARVKVVEGKAHEHANKAELDKIVEGDVAKWNAAEQNAKDYADGLDEAMDTRVAALEGMFGDGEGTVESQIAAAVATETSAREAADTALGNRVKTIEDDYLKAADKTALQEQITANDGEIAALQGLVGDDSVSDQIDAKIADLDLGNAYAAKSHTHAIADVTGLQDALDDKEAVGAAAQALADAKVYTDGKVKVNTDAIAAIKDGTSIDSFADVEAALAGKQAVGDYATKAEAQGYADAKDAAIEAAQAAADKAQGEVDALEGVVGALPEGETSVVAYIEKKTSGIATDAALGELQSDVSTLETLVGDTAVATQISNAVKEEADRAKGVESGLETRLAKVEGDYLVEADKTELSNAIAAEKERAEGVEAGLEGRIETMEAFWEAAAADGTDTNVIDTLKEIQEYIASDESGASAMAASIKQNADDIDALEGKMTAAETAIGTKAAQADLNTLADRVTTVEGKVSTLEGEMDAVEEKVALIGDKSVSEQITTAVDGLKNNELKTMQGEIDAVEGRATALEAKSHEHANKALLDTYTQTEANLADAVAKKHEHANKTVLDGITAEKVAAWDKVSEKANSADLATVATSGKIDDLVQDEGTFVIFDCGTSSTNI